MPGLSFAKYEGLGNDFVLVDAADEGAVGVKAAVAICDRRFGVGADGVLLVLPPRGPGAMARMKVINADGSVPEMCGNGLRCVALHLAHREHLAEVAVETDAGLRHCILTTSPGGDELVTVDMGNVRALGERTVDVEGGAVSLWLADAGNPHAVYLPPATRAEIAYLGPRLATHAAFPEGTNVGFASLRDGGIDLVVWERGVGLTLACGTGACAAVAVVAERGLLPHGTPVDVRLPGGTLTIDRVASGETRMRGPARHVFSGQLAASG